MKRGQNGFTLIELVIVLTVLMVLAGAAAPLLSKALERERISATLEEMEVLRRASLDYFRDTMRLPRKALDLVRDPRVPGWAGPYVSGGYDRKKGGRGSDLELDAWGRPYVFQLRKGVLKLRSAGPDGQSGKDPDFVLTCDPTPIRRAWTLDRLERINAAILAWNRHNLPRNPLPPNYPVLLKRLVNSGYLPAYEPFLKDGWGQVYVPDPPGRMPVAAVTSRRFLD